MKILHLLRHAKSSWDNNSLADWERPLAARGERACEIMAEPIVEAGARFNAVFCSTAVRAESTIAGIADALQSNTIRWKLDRSLYTFSGSVLLRYCQMLNDQFEQVMLVGHNPAMTDLVNRLGDQVIDNVPTCGYVQLQLDCTSWKQVDQCSGKTTVFLTPKMVISGDGR